MTGGTENALLSQKDCTQHFLQSCFVALQGLGEKKKKEARQEEICWKVQGYVMLPQKFQQLLQMNSMPWFSSKEKMVYPCFKAYFGLH